MWSKLTNDYVRFRVWQKDGQIRVNIDNLQKLCPNVVETDSYLCKI